MRLSGPSMMMPTFGAYTLVPLLPSSGLKSRTLIVFWNVPAGTVTVFPLLAIVA
jgi:hypothetical protein